VAVPRRPIDGHTSIHKALAGVIDIVDTVGEVAEIASAIIGFAGAAIFGRPIVGQFDLGDTCLPRRGKEDQREPPRLDIEPAHFFQPDQLEEERRLAYVGITRAERLCTISFAANRRVYGQWQSQMPSRFIDELPPEHVTVLTPPGLYGGGYGAAAYSGVETRAAQANVYNSPGWQLMQARGPTRGTTSHKEARALVIDATALPAHDIGARVFHQKFGYGTVSGADGDKLTVDFDKAGVKHLMASFVTAADAVDDVPF